MGELSAQLADHACGFCRRFPLTWHQGNWKCRSAGRVVNRADMVCDHWEAANPDEFEHRMETTTNMREVLRRREDRREQDVRDRAEQARVADVALEKRRRSNWPLTLLQERGGVVYVVDCEKYTKIGFTNGTAPERVMGLMGANPFEIKIYAIVHGDTATERKLHKTYKDFHHRLEWFLFDDEGRQRLRQQIIEMDGVVYDGVHAPRVDDVLAKARREMRKGAHRHD